MNPTEKVKDIQKKIWHSERKIELMKKNGSIGSIIDKLAGNNIAIERCKVTELRTALKFAQMESEIYEKNLADKKMIIEFAAIAALLLFFQM